MDCKLKPKSNQYIYWMPVTVLGCRENIKYKINDFNLKKVSKFLCSSEDHYQSPVNSSRFIPLHSEVFFPCHKQRWLVSIVSFIKVILRVYLHVYLPLHILSSRWLHSFIHSYDKYLSNVDYHGKHIWWYDIKR